MSIKNQNECSEILFLELINELEKKAKKTIQQENKKIPKEQILKEKKQIDFFNNNNIWFFSTFNTNLSKSKIEYPIIGNKWSKLENAKIYNSEIKNLIFKSENEINYTICNCYIKYFISRFKFRFNLHKIITPFLFLILFYFFLFSTNNVGSHILVNLYSTYKANYLVLSYIS